MSALNARSHVLDMIRSAAERAAEKGVDVTIRYSEFTVDGKIEATVTALHKQPAPHRHYQRRSREDQGSEI